MTDCNLKEYYNKLYSDGKATYWNDYNTSELSLSESQCFIIDTMKETNLIPKSVLDFGCGEGEFLDFFKSAPLRTGIDFSEVAIETAKQRHANIDFILGNEDIIKGSYDLVTSVGVIEHVDNPEYVFKKLYNATASGGQLYVICPNHCNIRGIIWQTLSLLFDVPMSLADKHVVNYSDVKMWIEDKELLDFRTFGADVAMGKRMIEDLNKRLTNALRDADMDNTKVDKLLSWLDHNRSFFPVGDLNGWLSVFIVHKK